MRALRFDKSVTFVPHHAEPAVTDGDSLLRVLQAGVSDEDLQIVHGGWSFTGILGHEFVGQVVQSPQKKIVGQRVVAEPDIACGRCDLCLSGLATHCRNRQAIGMLAHDGCFADSIRLPERNLHVLPSTIDNDQAIFICQVASALQVLKQVQVDSKKWITVLGDGTLALLCAQVLRNAGCPIRLIGTNPDLLALCEKWGVRSRLLADISPRHDQDIVIACMGRGDGLGLAIQLARPRGTVVVKHCPPSPQSINLVPLVRDEIQIIGSRAGSIREAINAIAEKSVDVLSLISRRVKIEQGAEAIMLADRPDMLKILITID